MNDEYYDFLIRSLKSEIVGCVEKLNRARSEEDLLEAMKQIEWRMYRLRDAIYGDDE